VMVFICYREAVLEGDFDYYAGGNKVDMSPLTYGEAEPNKRIDISAPEVVAKIRARFPEFAPCAYLNGTERPDSFKWLLSMRLGTRRHTFGWVGPKMMEIVQTWYHLTSGRYMAYASPTVTRRGRSLLLLAPFDKGMRKIASRVFRSPRMLFSRLHSQSVMIIQPIDVLPDGRQNMCDGCPDVTVWNNRLVWSCRLEECLHFGQFVRTTPKSGSSTAESVH